MLRKKLISLVGIAVLAMGISSQASADPVITVTYSTDDVADSTLRNYFFDVSYAGCPDTGFGDVCGDFSVADLALFSFDIFFSVDEVVTIGAMFFDAAWDAFIVAQPDAGNIFDPDGLVGVDSTGDGVGFDPASIFSFAIQVDIGDFLESASGPWFDFFGFGGDFFFVDADGFDCLPDGENDPNCTEEFFPVYLGGDFAALGETSLSELPGVSVPEPGTLGLLGLGLLGLGAARRRRRKI